MTSGMDSVTSRFAVVEPKEYYLDIKRKDTDVVLLKSIAYKSKSSAKNALNTIKNLLKEVETTESEERRCPNLEVVDIEEDFSVSCNRSLRMLGVPLPNRQI